MQSFKSYLNYNMVPLSQYFLNLKTGSLHVRYSQLTVTQLHKTVLPFLHNCYIVDHTPMTCINIVAFLSYLDYKPQKCPHHILLGSDPPEMPEKTQTKSHTFPLGVNSSV